MEDQCEIVEQLLQSTGLSCEDLLRKLQKYKSVKDTKVVNEDSSSSSNLKQELLVQQQHDIDKCNSVILDTKSSTLDCDNDTLLEAHTGSNTLVSSDNIQENLDVKINEKTSDTEVENSVEDKCSASEHNYSTAKSEDKDVLVESEASVSDGVDATATAEEATKSEEDLRNILRLQLSSLRNMKKSSGYLSDIKKKSVVFHNLKKKRKSCDVSPLQNDDAVDKKIEENNEPEAEDNNPMNDNSLVSLTEETQFLIMDVSGGVDKLTSEPLPGTSEERRFREINSTRSEMVSPKDETVNRLMRHPQKRRNVGDSQTLRVKKYMTENFDYESEVKDPIKNSENSPFVSDSLDDFLNESAKLQISYAIPKLRAEEGITENTKTSPYSHGARRVFKSKSSTESDSCSPKDKPKLMKAKTLADMRRQFEKLKTKDQTSTSSFVQKKKFRSASKHYLVRIPYQRNNYIIYDNKRIWVNSKINAEHKCLAIIDPITGNNTGSQHVPVRKPSLLSALMHNKPKTVKYRPGPLSKKASLQDMESRKEWTTEVKTLPKVYLEIAPQLGKPIDPKLLHLLPIFEKEIITQERANFALSVLKPRNSINNTETFKFPVSYKNKQEKFVVRKPFVKEMVYGAGINKKEEDPQAEISNVLNDIISYIEVKEIEDSLVKEDSTVIEELDSALPETHPKHKGRKAKRKKLEMELFRLNCKVIDVATKAPEDKQCNKSYCKLGCVCNSLLCENVFSNHCQLVECMFGCTCSSESNTAPNSLSVHTVNHLEDKVKKDLAKEEREFTQTLIHTDNDVILVGKGNVRRTSKAPKKFRDYVGDLDELFESPPPPTTEKKPIEFKHCNVLLRKYPLDTIVPLCLTHQVYDCFCKGKTIDSVKTEPIVTTPKPRLDKKKEVQKTRSPESCARMRPVFSQYIERNKEPLYNDKLRMKYSGVRGLRVKEEEFEDVIDPLSDDVKVEPLKKSSKRKQSFNVREEVFACKYSPEQFAMQRRKKKTKMTAAKSTLPIGVFDGEITLSLKDNEEILQTIGEGYRSMEYLRILPWDKLIESFRTEKMRIWAKGNSSSSLLCNTKFHLPPKNFVDINNILQSKSDIVNWILTDELPIDIPRELMHIILIPKKTHFAISGYCLKNINNNQKMERLTKVEDPKSSPESSLIDLDQVQEGTTVQKNDFKKLKKIRLIKPNMKEIEIVSKLEPLLPAEASAVDVSPQRPYAKHGQKSAPPKVSESLSASLAAQLKLYSDATIPNQNNYSGSTKNVKCSHKDMNNKMKFLVWTSKAFTKRKLFLSQGHKGFEIAASLPQLQPTKNFRWRMIYLNSDFTFLSFVAAKYSIKYTDLMDVVKMAVNLRSTITLRNAEFCDSYKHPLFGIYCVPDYQDRLFVGPYLPTEKHNIETYRYLRGNLIETQIFNAMVGREVTDKNPDWIYETPSAPLVLPRGLVIDITHDEEDVGATEVSLDDNFDEKTFQMDSLLCPPFVEELSRQEIQSRYLNRYIVTNIPHLGYFGACQRNTKAIEVFWPNYVKGYRFPNVTFAKNLMIRYLSQVFCSVPQDFKINVIILTHLDFNTNKPVSPKYFTHCQSAPFFCGEFGIYDKSSLPGGLLKTYNIPSVEALLTAHQKQATDEEASIRLFGLFLMSNEELRRHIEPADILRWATSEVYILKKLKENYEREKVDLHNMILSNSQKFKELQKQHTVTETIEIDDSDEEEDGNVGFKKITHSGKVQNGSLVAGNNRSLLKSKMCYTPGRSLLKIRETEGKMPIASNSPNEKV